jgi:hypothetical protein
MSNGGKEKYNQCFAHRWTPQQGYGQYMYQVAPTCMLYVIHALICSNHNREVNALPKYIVTYLVVLALISKQTRDSTSRRPCIVLIYTIIIQRRKTYFAWQ